MKIFLLVKNSMKSDSRVYNIAKYFSENNYQVFIFANKTESMLEVECVDANIKILRKFTSSEIYNIKMISVYFSSIRPRIVWCNDYNTLHIGFFLKLIYNDFINIYDSHEWWAERMALYSDLKKSIIRKLERFYVKFTDINITVNSFLAKRLSILNSSRFHVIYNVSEIQPLFSKIELRKELNLPLEKKIIVYAGAIHKCRCIYEFLEVLNKISDDFVGLILGDDYNKNLQKSPYYKSLLDNGKLIKIDAVIPKLMYKYINASDLGYLLQEKICKSYDFSTPTKMFYYMMAGIPSLMSDNTPSFKVINKQYGIGILSTINNVDKIIENIYEIMDEKKYLTISECCRKISVNKFNWNKQKSKLTKILKSYL